VYAGAKCIASVDIMPQGCNRVMAGFSDTVRNKLEWN